LEPFKPILKVLVNEFPVQDSEIHCALDLRDVLLAGPKVQRSIFVGQKQFVFIASDDCIPLLDDEGNIYKFSLFLKSISCLTLNGRSVIIRAEDLTHEPKWNKIIDKLKRTDSTSIYTLRTSPYSIEDGRYLPTVNHLLGRELTSEIYLSSITNNSCFIFFQGSSYLESRNLYERFSDSLKNEFLKHPTLEALMLSYLKLKISYNEVSEQLLSVTEKIKIADTFVEIAKSKYKDDYERLFTFYHNEYEVLPLWYKRFGHILKALTGKRSLKSLFDNSSKKHV
jgi:hypothetical protein